ncbi:MAG: DUF362 domain-containing protein [Candidatus Omnitrophica bacterium]|nr:DUF362 domain-containing protein [Candidatus Omnitrophota bacterium]
MKSNVYFIEVKADDGDPEARCDALQKLLEKVNPFRCYKKDEFIPVKLTIGDSQCIYNTRPELVKIIISEIKKLKAKPFLFDTNVIYKGERLNAIDHMNLAQSKGFGYTKVGAPFIIADGVFGQDGKEHAIDSDYIKKIKTPSFIGSLESLVVLSHATGHILSGYAGAIKNIAMGMCSRPTKQVQHSSLKPHIMEKKCIACGCCIKICPAQAISSRTRSNPQPEGHSLNRGTKYAAIDQAKCIGCGECLCACKFDAIFINWSEDHDIFAKRMIDVAHFILSKFKNKFFIAFGFDITKECDCISTKDELIFSENIGILASADPLAIDKAMVDLINKNKDAFKETGLLDTHKTMFEYGHKKGLGNLDYNLIKI